MNTYCGIADAYGLESFMECEEVGSAPMSLTMRARMNRQRHAMVYWVELPDDKVEQMNEAIRQAQEDGDWHEPLLLLKNPDFVENVSFENSMKRSWHMIPNNDLDPGWGGEEE
tara:strand:- start:736 stop:1074 length:339 start_codon:yes stop_codon:yes gene_type:complete